MMFAIYQWGVEIDEGGRGFLWGFWVRNLPMRSWNVIIVEEEEKEKKGSQFTNEELKLQSYIRMSELLENVFAIYQWGVEILY